jgi:DNA-binding NtrC family response regulator
VRELQNIIERAIILSENGRPVSAGALGLPMLARPPAGSPVPPVMGTIAPFPGMPTPPADPQSLPAVSAAAEESEPARPPAVIEKFVPNPPDDNPPPAVAPPADSAMEIVSLDELERRAILRTLQATGGNRTKTAELLKISIRTLRNKLQEYRAAGLVPGAELESGE